MQIAPDLSIAKIKKAAVEMEEDEAKSSAGGGKMPPSKGLDNVANMAVDALAKETKYEQLAEKEELDREVMQEFEDRKRLEEMKLKDECLERENRKANAPKAPVNEQVAQLKEGIKNMILNQRAEASKRIEVMKKLADRKRRATND